ncbi:MAG: alanyl-tRNA editing protein [Thermoplasmata archaeon]
MRWLYLEDAYLKEFDANVVKVEENRIYLDATAFYPGGGGQPPDSGEVISQKGFGRVVGIEGEAHIIEGTLPEVNEKIHCRIDWARRYRIMRTHTAVHLISGVAYRKFGVTITGNQLYEGSARVDLSFENMNSELAKKIIEESNLVAVKGIEVKAYYISKDEFLKRSELMRVNPALYEKYENIRIVEIADFDAQADGGTHVRNTAEIGKIIFKGYESKGKKNKRIYIELE